MEGKGVGQRDGIQSVEQPARRTGIVRMKIMVIGSLICGGIILLLWGILGFPGKFGKPKVLNDQTCSKDATLCPQGWMRIKKKCFFPSEQEATWANGQADCMTHHGTLATLHSKNDLESLMEYVRPSSYWIGLNKLNENKLWTWANGTLFANWYNIEEGGDCAFIFKKGISSANCDDARKYICSINVLCSYRT